MKKPNDIAKWIIVALAVAGFIFNTGVIWNDVKHNRESIQEIKQEMSQLRLFVMEKK